MQGTAIIKNISISPKKTRIPAMIVRGMKVDEALNALKFMEKGTAQHVYKAIKSAAANAMQKQAKVENLVVSDIRIDKGGNRIKHYHPRAKGGGYYVWIRGKAHITIVVSDDSAKDVKTEKKEKRKEKDVEGVEGKSIKKKAVKKVIKTDK